MLLETDIMKYFIKTLSQKVCIILFTYTVYVSFITSLPLLSIIFWFLTQYQ